VNAEVNSKSSSVIGSFESSPRDGATIVLEIERALSAITKERMSRIEQVTHADLMRLLKDIATRLASQTQWSSTKVQREVLEPIAKKIIESAGTSRDRDLIQIVTSEVVDQITLLNPDSASKKENFDRTLLKRNIERIGNNILEDLQVMNRLREFSIQESKKINSVNRFIKNDLRLRDYKLHDEDTFHTWVSLVAQAYANENSETSPRVTYLNDWLSFVANLSPYHPNAILLYQKNPRSRKSFEERYELLAEENIFRGSWTQAHQMLNVEVRGKSAARTSPPKPAAESRLVHPEIKVNGETVEFWFEIALDQEPLRAERQFAIIRETQKLPGAMPASLRYILNQSHQFLVISTTVGSDEAWIPQLLEFAIERFSISKETK
jgi:hypothetical protein